MKSIRRGVFETNSSSTHSITISSNVKTFGTLPVEDGVVTIEAAEFGWEYAEYRDPSSKASYAAIWARDNGTAEDRILLLKVIQDHTGAEKVIVPPDSPNRDEGYIDHQSDHVCQEAFENERTLKNFIFNSESVLITDNDND